MNIRDDLRNFITAELMRDPTYDLGNSEALISGGLIDSFSLVELQLFIDKQFSVLIDDTELTTDTIDCLDDIVSLVQQRR